MNAHRLVIIAAALTTAVAAAVVTALAAFSGQALPRAISHVVGTAAGTTLLVDGGVNADQAARYDSVLAAKISSAPEPNVVLVTGSAIDHAQLSAVASMVILGSGTTFRASTLASLSGSPLQHGATLLVTLTIATCAAFGLFIVVLGLALGSAERELTLARLAVMGHERATWLVMAEALPAVIAAIVAGAACALALPRVIGSSIDLSVFTGTSTPVQFQPDAAALGLPAAAIGVLAVAVLAAQARALRRRSVTGMLRIN